MRHNIKLFTLTLVLTALLVFASRCRAADYSVRFGPGLTQGGTTGDTKMFGVRREAPLTDRFNYALEVGGFNDNAYDDHKASPLIKTGIGVTPGPNSGTFAKVFTGPCYLAVTDSRLGGHLQFCSDVAVGIRDSKTFMSVGYLHISSAGLSLPNKGRDYMIVEAGVRF